ncbi:MAG TPA: fused MFS/spermidine synthase, partial [Candidatus Methylacidiphilales bacterium]|nr:fused MFS/spermidine synthase [Candidatus Methylacidiphilales bacterium]
MSDGPQSADPGKSTLFGYISVVAVLLAAFLLFLIQPLAAKAIIPWFGGAASTWSVVMLYFQGLLLAGYLASFILQNLQSRIQSISYIVICLLAIGFSYAHPYLHSEWISNDYPLLGIIITLIRYVTLPGLLLATVSTMVQVWYSSVYKREPYILYSISNIGSLASLILYPFLIEPNFTLAQTFLGWQVLIVMCALCCIALALLNLSTRRLSKDDSMEGQIIRAATPWRSRPGRIALWIYLPACSCALLVSMTHYLCRDIAPIPLLWILPLALYLVTYIVAFGPGKQITDIVWVYLCLIAIAFFLYIFTLGTHATLWFLVSGLFLLYAVCQFCHSYMVAIRPGSDRLTTFYLCLAIGGFLGSALVNLVLPFVFTDHSDLWLCLMLSLFALIYRIYRTGAFQGYVEPSDTLRYRSLCAVLAGTVVVCGYVIYLLEVTPGIKERNFYGIIKVKEQITTVPSPGGGEPIKVASLTLQDGNTVHGMQFKDEAKKDWATTYYSTTSGAGVLIKDLREKRTGPLSIGVIGLGAGTLSTYARPGDSFAYYEINPAVVRVAQRDFSFLRNSKAAIDIIVGDARLSLADGPLRQFDLLVVDAFSSDSVPAHLLTREAFEIYLKHVKPDGFLAFHISNRYLDLARVVTGAAMQFKLHGVVALGQPDEAALITPSEYVILSRNPVQLSVSDK